jgi:hypothetical protein
MKISHIIEMLFKTQKFRRLDEKVLLRKLLEKKIDFPFFNIFYNKFFQFSVNTENGSGYETRFSEIFMTYNIPVTFTTHRRTYIYTAVPCVLHTS